jgi:hypothetical protein
MTYYDWSILSIPSTSVTIPSYVYFSDGYVNPFSWEEKLVAPLIATPNVDRAIEDKKDGQKSYATGYTCNSRLQKGITILFCKQIGQCPSTNYASSLSGFKILGKLKWRELCSRQFLS